MHEPAFIPKPGVVYHPPKLADIERYVEQVCETLAEQHGEAYRESEVRQGLSEFLNVTATIYARHLSGPRQ